MPDALTPSQIELLRGLPKSRDERLTTPEERGVIGLLLGTPRNTIDLLLATVDAAVAAERERVLAEIDEAVERVADPVVEGILVLTVGIDGGEVCVKGRGPSSTRATFSEALAVGDAFLAATPKEQNDG